MNKGKHAKKKEPINIPEITAQIFIALGTGTVLLLIDKYII